MKRLLIFLWGIFFALTISAQSKHTVSGYITDSNGESLIGANVIVTELTKGTVTNHYGFFSLTLPQGKYTLLITYLGYTEQQVEVDLKKDQRLNFKLEESTEMIESVEVTARKKDVNVKAVTMSTERLDIKTIKKIPTLMGETDIIKVIQLQPGVQTVGEGTSGFFVRGGAVDQNLILLDEAVVYNPAHMGGFFSVFNGDAIQDVTLYKGGIPSRYGGRLSSVLDVRMKEGNQNKISVAGGIGVISSRLTVEGPVVRDRTSFIISGRRTYYDLFFPLSKNEALKQSKSYFYDMNAKINHKINDNNRIYISAYGGQDVARFGDLFEMSYGNKTGTIRWNHLYSNRLFSNLMFIYSNFNYELGQPTGAFAFTWTSNIIDLSVKNDYTYFLNPNNTLSYGFQVTHHTIKPGNFEPSSESNFAPLKIESNYALESALFIGNEQKVSDKLTLKYGLRISMLNNVGGTVYNYDDDFEVVDSTVYDRGAVYNTDYGFEPRVSARYLINPSTSVKTSYNRTYQYLHLATNTAASTPVDIWFSSNPNIEPQYADQVALGLFKNFNDNNYEVSVEGYYKWMHDAIDFKDHASLIGNKHLDGELRRGSAYSYGLEFYLKKQQGRFTGWISYTLSKTRRKIDGVNNGEEYPSPYDRPHDLKIVASYDITPRLNVSANWIYYTALPMTVASQWYKDNNMWVPVYSDRNSFRFPSTNYHRLDVSATWEFAPVNNKWDHSLTLSAYNVYNRHNMYSVAYKENKAGGPPELHKMYLFGIVPSLTYNFKF